MSRRHTPRDGHTSTEPLDVDRATNTAVRHRTAVPEDALAARQALKAAGLDMSLRNVTRLGLDRVYVRFMENAQSDWDFGGYVLTYLSRGGSVSRSVPADPMAERLVGSLI